MKIQSIIYLLFMVACLSSGFCHLSIYASEQSNENIQYINFLLENNNSATAKIFAERLMARGVDVAGLVNRNIKTPMASEFYRWIGPAEPKKQLSAAERSKQLKVAAEQRVQAMVRRGEISQQAAAEKLAQLERLGASRLSYADFAEEVEGLVGPVSYGTGQGTGGMFPGGKGPGAGGQGAGGVKGESAETPAQQQKEQVVPAKTPAQQPEEKTVSGATPPPPPPLPGKKQETKEPGQAPAMTPKGQTAPKTDAGKELYDLLRRSYGYLQEVGKEFKAVPLKKPEYHKMYLYTLQLLGIVDRDLAGKEKAEIIRFNIVDWVGGILAQADLQISLLIRKNASTEEKERVRKDSAKAIKTVLNFFVDDGKKQREPDELTASGVLYAYPKYTGALLNGIAKGDINDAKGMIAFAQQKAEADEKAKLEGEEKPKKPVEQATPAQTLEIKNIKAHFNELIALAAPLRDMVKKVAGGLTLQFGAADEAELTRYRDLCIEFMQSYVSSMSPNTKSSISADLGSGKSPVHGFEDGLKTAKAIYRAISEIVKFVQGKRKAAGAEGAYRTLPALTGDAITSYESIMGAIEQKGRKIGEKKNIGELSELLAGLQERFDEEIKRLDKEYLDLKFKFGTDTALLAQAIGSNKQLAAGVEAQIKQDSEQDVEKFLTITYISKLTAERDRLVSSLKRYNKVFNKVFNK